MTTITEALSSSSAIVAAWGGDDDDPAWLGIYAVGAEGARLIAHDEIPRAERASYAATMSGRGIPIGKSDGDVVWVLDDGSFLLWSTDGAIADGTPSELRFGGDTISARDVSAVFSFINAADIGHRGVMLELTDGRRLLLFEEHDPAALADPGYNLNDVIFDGAWARNLGYELAAWLRVPYRGGRVPASECQAIRSPREASSDLQS